MRILLIKPPLNKNLLAPNNDEPLELECVAAAVEGHEVDILDMRIEKNLWKKLGSFRPDIVGITAYTCDVRMAQTVLQEINKFSGSINIVEGGHHATVLTAEYAGLPEEIALACFSRLSIKTPDCYYRPLGKNGVSKKWPGFG